MENIFRVFKSYKGIYIKIVAEESQLETVKAVINVTNNVSFCISSELYIHSDYIQIIIDGLKWVAPQIENKITNIILIKELDFTFTHFQCAAPQFSTGLDSN